MNSRIDILVCYDVNTEEPAGRRRLNRVAKICTAYGQRVQKSVFECTITPTQLEQFKRRLLKVIDPNQDSLRFYRLVGGREQCTETYGRDSYRDFEEPLVL